jgi:hypothetical protein
MADPRDHDAPIWVITMGGTRTKATMALQIRTRFS